eukprot:COSAG01_NODE_10022_length_2272_cov_30.590428_1_plen_59_part_10
MYTDAKSVMGFIVGVNFQEPVQLISDCQSSPQSARPPCSLDLIGVLVVQRIPRGRPLLP